VRHHNECIQKSVTTHKPSISIIQNKRRLENPALRCPFDTHAYVMDKRYRATHSSALATLPRFENTHNYDSYYYQQYNDGNAHPFS